MRRLPTRHRLVTALLLAAGAIGSVHAATITREFSSVWFNPAKSGHGLGLEVIDGGNGTKTLLAYWFTYDAQGRQMWVFGSSPITGDTVRMTGYVTSGGSFDNRFDPDAVRSTAWGTLEFAFTDCDNGSLRYTPNDAAAPAGTMPLTRLTRLFNSTCSGGISDDRVASDAGSRSSEFLVNRRVYPAASARSRVEDRPGRVEFSVELEDLPVGNYTLRVDDVVRGTVAVAASTRGTRGELEFRSPAEPGKQLLDFDPRGAIVEVLEGNRVLFDSVLAEAPPSTGTPTPPSGAPAPGNAEYELVLEPQGNDGPELDAKLELRRDRVEFSVELEDVAAGSYSLQVGGAPRGTIDVVAVPGGTEGEIEFRNPVEPGKFVLDFDPRGAALVVTRNGATVFSGTFPTTPGSTPDDNGGDDDDDDGHHGGGSDDDGDDDNGGNGGGGSDDDDGDDGHHGGGSDDDGDDDNGSSGGGGSDDDEDDGHHGGGGDDDDDDDDDNGGHGGGGDDDDDDDDGRHGGGGDDNG